MNNPVFILGGYQTDFSRNFAKEGKNEIALLKETMAMNNRAGSGWDPNGEALFTL